MKPNVVWIYCDELRADALGCYAVGAFQPRTPNIDRLASMGIRYERCYCNAPVCVPSRTSTLTARPPEATGVFSNESCFQTLPVRGSHGVLPEWFEGHGYATANFGKVHVPESLCRWGHHDPTGGGLQEIVDQRDPGVLPVSVSLLTNHAGRTRPGLPYPAEEVARRGLEWAGNTPQPFFVRFSILQPHTPVFPPPPYDRMYENAEGIDGYPTPLGDVSVFQKRFASLFRTEGLTPEEIRATRVCYHGLVAWVDAQVGRILEELERRDLLSNTVIVFDADHGVSKADQGCYSKHTFAPHVHRVPRIVVPPGGSNTGSVDDGLCQSMDLARTLCGLCGIPPDPAYEGRDLLNTGPDEAVFSTIGIGGPDSRALPEIHTGRWVDGRGWPRRGCIRTERYRLDANLRIDGRPAEEEDLDVFLADTVADPEETTNLWGAPGHEDAGRDLLARLLARRDSFAEEWRV